jgi:hypothetical protein
MIVARAPKGSKASFSWRLRLQTSGIYRIVAIPGWYRKTGGAADAEPRPGLAPESALRLHPCRALSSAPVSNIVSHGTAEVKVVVVVGREE